MGIPGWHSFSGGRRLSTAGSSSTSRRNSRIGGTVVVPFEGWHAVKIGYAKGLFTEFGTDFEQFS